MFTFHFPPFSPFVCQTKPDMETTKIQKTRKWAWPMERSIAWITHNFFLNNGGNMWQEILTFGKFLLYRDIIILYITAS